MNRNCYRLVFNTTLGMMVPVAETARRSGKAGSGKAVSGAALALAGALLAGAVHAELPVASANFAAPGTTASYQTIGTQAYVNQVGNKAIMNFDRFNISAGHDVQFRQVDGLATQNLVQGASFSALARIHDINPSIIIGSMSQAAGQRANVTLVNSNGIAFMNGSQVNLGSFTASTLNIADSFITDSLLTNSTGIPQFEKALDGSEGRGFIKVFEGAQITAGSFGRVMLIAPTVVIKGKVDAPDGQIIAAAGSKVYLRSAAGQDNNVNGLLVEVDSPDGLADYNADNTSVRDGMLDGQAVALTDAADDKLGHVTNLGELSSSRGNVTMIGYAVNQRGIARATTSVVANGSVYLLARDEAVSNSEATRGGRVILGAGSKTEVLPDAADATGAPDGTTGQGLAKRSQVMVLGQEIEMQGGANIAVPSGEVNLIALDNPGQLDTTNDPFKNVGQPVSAQARVRIASGAVIDVAGLENVQVSVARNSVAVELRGDELKDSPVNRAGPLRGETVYLDVNRALANADAGQSTLIARDSLESYQAKLERTVAERSTTGGTVTVKSQGAALLESGAVFNLSGGSVQYTAANVKTTLLTTNGKSVDLADADAETRYDGIATRYVKDFGRWNVKKVFDLGQSYRTDSGYTEGKDAGVLNVIGMTAVQIQSDIQGETITGEQQSEAGIQPKGATLKLGSGSVTNDYKLNQKVLIGAVTASDVNTLALNTALFGQDKIANLEVFSNQAAEVREALRLPQGGSVAITAKGVAVNADVDAAAGKISFNARGNGVDTATAPLEVTVADGVTLAARGGWANDLPTAPGQSDEATLVNGGTVTLSAAENVTLGAGSLIDVTGGGRLKPDGKIKNGKGGNVTLEAGVGASAGGSHTASVELGGAMRGHALGKGGTFKLNTRQIQIGGAQDPAALNLGTGFFTEMGFATFDLTGRDGVTVADGVTLSPRVTSLELQPGYTLQPTASRIETFSRPLMQEDRVRQTADLTLTADGTDFGVVKLGDGAKIQADDRAKVVLNAGKRIEIQGEVTAAGGDIQAKVSGDTTQPYDAANTVWLGAQALLDVSGVARTYRDGAGLTQGEVLNAGSVSLEAVTGFVVTEAGSVIRANGAAPVRLDVRNEAGGLGRDIGSDAGAIKIAAREGALLDGALHAQSGSASNRGGSLDFTLGNDLAPQGGGFPADERVLSIAPAVAVQAGGLAPGDAMPDAFNGQANLSAQMLDDAGFDRIALKSRDVIRLENDLDLGSSRSLPLREIKLDTPRLETAGGDASLTAATIRLGNYDAAKQQGIPDPVAGTGVFKANAQLLELAGSQTFSGMERAELTGSQEVRLVGVSTDAVPRPSAMLKTAADLVIHGALVAPSTYSRYTIDAAGRLVSFTRNTNVPVQPISALGSLTVIANDITQDGNLWAPLGQIDFQASNSLVFKDGSLTSVSAAPGSLIPLGKIENGRSWAVEVSSGVQITIEDVPEKAIRTQAASIDMQPGAKVDISGGGDLQAYEFTVGPGGSRDMLADKNTYAILPGYTGGFAPADSQEGFDRASGESVYLSGVPGLADGVYVLLPAHYALLPGAYAVKLDSGIKNVMPGQAYSKPDGVRVAAGYVTDSRALTGQASTPKDASWQGIQVLTHDQVRARSEYTLIAASQFFADSHNRPQDAGLLSVATTGSGANALKIDAVYNLAAGLGGRGARVDVSARDLAIVSGSPAGIDPDAVQVDVDKLNAMGADSLFIGGTRSASGDTTTLTVGADAVTLANDASHALKASEIILAANDTLTLKAGSAIDAQGETGDAGYYETAGNGALVRASSTTAAFSRTDNPDRTQGTLIGEAGSTVAADDSIALDATKENAFKGATKFERKEIVNGVVVRTPVAGNLAVGATRINFGAAPVTAEGITYSQAELNAFDSLNGLTLTSYTTFDLYTGKTETVNGVVTTSGVKVGGLDGDNKPTLQNLTLQGAGLAGIDNAGQTAQLNAKNLTLSNPNNAATFIPGGTLGSGILDVTADTLTLGEGNKKIQGFSAVNVTANELVGRGTGETDIFADTTLLVARIRGERNADQTLDAVGKLEATEIEPGRELLAVNALGAKWAMAGTEVMFDTLATLPSGYLKLTATN
ncbi:MAG: ESPR-type extended signal peptide-containing protein, partial [Thiobacillus sp.]|nr:ESPR-type extended signal peptide-containing protein [Thiobacillus sp.]